MTVRELEQRIDSDEVSEWMAKRRIDYWPWQRLEIMIAQLTWLVASVGLKGKHSIDDFLILRDKPPKQTPDDMWSLLLRTLEE